MSGVVANRVRQGFYLDSVALMRIAAQVEALDGVENAALMIGTPANMEILAAAGLLAEGSREATPRDLIIAVRAAEEEALETALGQAETLLLRPRGENRPGAAGAQWRPKTLRGAARRMEGANLALISVPGAFAAAEAHRALREGLHVLLFSDNVSLEEELALKTEARERGLLVMGPDCGTAIIGGVPLAFANVVPRGNVGIVSASGTGLQEVSSIIARLGGGVSHGIGTGGRDLSDAVGGLTTFAAIDALEADPATTHIVLLSKPLSPKVAARVLERVANGTKPFTICFLGLDLSDLAVNIPSNAALAATLQEAAERPLGASLLQHEPPPPAVPARPGGVRGLFAGGTLCAEAQAILLKGGKQVYSNAPIPGARPASGSNGAAHLLLDLGADEFTVGHPHPMMEPGPRNKMVTETLREKDVAVVLLDVVLGHGAHEDPAAGLALAVAETAAFGPDRPHVVASVCGTEGDPQGRAAQVEKLREAGVVVAPSNAAAAVLALQIAGGNR
ncbi:MAG: acyl-CoA synthetase FdrA [SAR324 cluster bacterium]|nr:acyl-CoA synthetase FdrA [SAR324 cluster bacterium]